MSTLELREQVHEAVELLSDEQLQVLLAFLRAFQGPTQTAHWVNAEATKREALKRIVQRMAEHPLDPRAPKLTRDALHERR